MEKTSGIGGYQEIFEDQLRSLGHADIASLAEHLGLAINPEGEAAIPFLGATYLLSNRGIRRVDGRGFPHVTGSALIRYLLTGSRGRPAGEFVTFVMLAGPVGQDNFSSGALERPIIKRFRGRTPELLKAAELTGGRVGGVGGLDSISLLFELLPHILLQLIFYDGNEEFPARATLLFDKNATKVLDFETMAVLVTVFVNFLVKTDDGAPGRLDTEPKSTAR